MKIFLVLFVVVAFAQGRALAEESSQNGNVDADTIDIIPTLHLRGASDMLLDDAEGPFSAGRGLQRRPRCTSNADCDPTTSYCNGRRCSPMGSCRWKRDCSLPGNIYPVVQCIGDILCSAEKQCFRQCKIEPGPCLSSSDCSEGEYCQRGVCSEMGSCLSDADCFNPNNLYPVIMCIGPVTCTTENRCGKKCSDTNCPADKPPVQCFESPCTVVEKTCTTAKVAGCADYYCGGCNAFAFDQAGNQVCQLKV